jgi:hypothetical protein
LVTPKCQKLGIGRLLFCRCLTLSPKGNYAGIPNICVEAIAESMALTQVWQGKFGFGHRAQEMGEKCFAGTCVYSYDVLRKHDIERLRVLVQRFSLTEARRKVQYEELHAAVLGSAHCYSSGRPERRSRVHSGQYEWIIWSQPRAVTATACGVGCAARAITNKSIRRIELRGGLYSGHIQLYVPLLRLKSASDNFIMGQCWTAV